MELPIGVAEDRITGSLHLESALSDGVTVFEPGLLARAHRGLLYVDEVNLLHDHVVDLLLDAAAMGRVTVERDGVSVEHAAPLGGFTGFTPARSVTQWSWRKSAERPS